MRKARFILILLFSAQFVFALGNEKENVWNTLLNDVKIKYAYSIKYNGLLPKPKFGKKLQALDGQIITIAGFFMPVDMTGDVFVLSYNPSNMCFFCNGAGIESIIELNPKEKWEARFNRLKTDNYFEVKGRLKLNAKDFEHLIYILDDVEFVRLISH